MSENAKCLFSVTPCLEKKSFIGKYRGIEYILLMDLITCLSRTGVKSC